MLQHGWLVVLHVWGDVIDVDFTENKTSFTGSVWTDCRCGSGLLIQELRRHFYYSIAARDL